MQNKKKIGPTAAVTVGAAMVLVAATGPMPAAYADTTTAAEPAPTAYSPKGPDCNLGCSSTVNETSIAAVAYFNWCRKGDSTGAWTTKRPKCKSDGAKQKTYHLAADDHTPWDQDWDAFRVDAGWCYRVFFDRSWPLPNRNKKYDRRDKSSDIWVKVGNEADAYIKKQSRKHC